MINLVFQIPTCLSDWDFFMCARQGAITKEWKSPMTPAGGIISQTARVSIVRWNLKEAAGKTLV